MAVSASSGSELPPAETCDTAHELGLAAFHSGRLDEALAHLRAAATAEPSNAEYVCALGMALAAADMMEPAAQCYAHALSTAPLMAKAHLGLGRARAAQGNPNAAIASLWQCRRLRPEDTPARIALADMLRACGYELAALRQERRAATSKNTATNTGNDTAGRCRDEAEAGRQLAQALAAAGQCEDAEAEILRAVIFDPDNPQNLLVLSAVYEQQERLDEAADALRLALAEDGSNAVAHIALGGILARLGELDSAEASLERALTLMPGAVEARLNLANIELERGHRSRALEQVERAIDSRPNYVQAHNNRANILLLQGRYGAGWDAYEWRRCMPRGAPAKLNIPDWRGQALGGKPLYVIGEQAAGDAIMFASCLGELAHLDGPVSLHCEERITGLMRRAFPWLTVSDRLPDDTNSAARDGYAIPLGSLPRLFRRSEAAFDGSGPYLVAPSAQLTAWRARYAALGEGLKIGFSWTGGKSHIQRRQRGMRLVDWAPLLGLNGAQFIDMQYGDHDAARADLRRQFGLSAYRPAEIASTHSGRGSSSDMDDFAAQIKALDLVISIDNTNVHFAGALGVPVWCLVPQSPSWRWQSERRDSPWYPSMILFRQGDNEPWKSVLDRAAEALAARLAEPNSGTEISTDRQILPPTTPRNRQILPPPTELNGADNLENAL